MSNGLNVTHADAMSSREMAGVGMLEFLVALLIFTTGMLSLMSVQLAGKKTHFEAGQRSVATALVRDILERIRANPGQIAAYQMDGIGDEASSLPPPDTDCDLTRCTAEQLAAFDLWQWEALLLGRVEADSAGHMGGLLAPRACIASDGGEVDVTISWRSSMAIEPTTKAECGIDDEPEGEQEQGEVPPRSQLTVSTFFAGR